MNRPWTHLRPWLVAVGLVALGFGSWRSFPVLDARAVPLAPLRVVLFDLSAGTTRLRPGYGLWARGQLREQAMGAATGGEQLAVGIYGRDVRSLGIAAPEEWLARLEGRGAQLLQLELGAGGELGSNLDAGLALFEEPLSLPNRSGASLVIAGLDDYSGPDPRPRLARLVQAGVQLEWVTPPASRRPDIALEGLRLPPTPAPGSPLVLELDLNLAAPAELVAGPAGPRQVQLQLQIENVTGVRAVTLSLPLPRSAPEPDGSLSWSVRQALGSTAEGLTHVSARVRLVDRGGQAQADPCPENDTLSTRCRSGNARLLGIVAGPEQHAALRSWIGDDPQRWPGLQWRVLEPSQLGAALGQLDLIVSVDLGPGELPPQLVKSFVQAGGGWLFCGGWSALGGWFRSAQGAAAGPSELLPLAPAPTGATPRDVVVLVDGSGSMVGEPFARVRAALIPLVLAVPPEDALSMHFFTGALQPAIDLRSSTKGVQEALRVLFEARVPGGPTAILDSLESLIAQRSQTTREALVILLSDGKEVNSFNVRKRAAVISEALSRGASRLVVIAAGDDPNLELLEALAGAAPLRSAGALDNLTELFQREVFERRTRAGDLGVLPAGAGGLAESVDLLRAWSSLDGNWPPVERYLRCEAQAGAEVLLLGQDEGEPLLAWQRVGRGKVAAWASAPLAGWAPAYRGADERLAPLLRLLARSPSAPGSPRLEWQAGGLALSSVPLDWPAELALTFYAQLPGLGMLPWTQELELARGSLTLGPSEPGQDPRLTRTGALPDVLLERALGRPLHVELRDPGDDSLLGQVGLDLPCDGEFRRSGSQRVQRAGLERPQNPATRAAQRVARVDPRAWIWILVGVSCLSLAALLGGLGPRKSQAMASP